MNEVGQQTVRAVFEVEWKNVKLYYNVPKVLDFLVSIIPGSQQFFDPKYEKRSIDRGRELGLRYQKMDKKLYMITDDPDIVHWIAFEEKWEKMANVIQHFLPTEIYIEPFYAEHMVWEGD